MKLPQQLKDNLSNELDFVIKKMTEEPNLTKKLYFFSAVNGALERASRFYFDRELLVAHAIMSMSYNMINDRISHLRIGDDTVPFTETLMTQLIAGISELKQAVDDEKPLYPAVETVMEVTYMTTGPGFYTRSFLDYVDTLQRGQEESK
jgi:hypothetical protein